jgi:sirohydrochlorin cobaltochelatase
MKTVIVLAMHGAPPKDFPRRETGELFALHARLEHAPPAERAGLQRRHDELDAKMRAWPRTPENDPFFVASRELGAHLTQATGHEVLVGFNEFCAPDLDGALDQAVERGANQVIVTTPMMTQGGEHAASDIPQVIQRVQARHPGVRFQYAWPFEVADVARFLAEQIELLT